MRPIIVLTTLYNCERYIPLCIASLKIQSQENFKCYILDDLSTDNSLSVAKALTKGDERFVVVKNDKKYYQPGNYDQILRNDNIDDDSIVIEVDGDDWLSQRNSIKIVESYHDKGYWITHGSFRYSTGKPGFSKPIKVKNLRSTFDNATHLRTWRAKLWKNIKKEDLMHDGWYAQTAGDVFFMLPILEMAGDDRICHIPLDLYIYNEENPINDHKVDMTKQWTLASIAKAKKRYEKI